MNLILKKGDIRSRDVGDIVYVFDAPLEVFEMEAFAVAVGGAREVAENQLTQGETEGEFTIGGLVLNDFFD